ncbi:MAG TPA: thioredoxin domain-containing protein [Pyrinomonadaceae bacterium]|nr:thioredoxin domain-containing protein [Pyrinomonadaceae bacterium]
MKRALPFLIIIAVLIGAVVIAWYLKESGTQQTPAPPGPTVSTSATPVRVTELGAEPPHAIGEANAPVTLEEYGDFQCPPCGLFHPILKQMESEFGAKLRVVFRQYPLVPAHAHALSAARAAEAAGMQGKFWPMHDLLYENQSIWKDEFDVRTIFEGFATKIGLDLEKYRRDLTSQTVEQRIFLDGKRARALGVKGTPTVFLNGREVPFESLPAEKLRVLIQNEIGNK